jgi:hypothetical protein
MESIWTTGYVHGGSSGGGLTRSSTVNVLVRLLDAGGGLPALQQRRLDQLLVARDVAALGHARRGVEKLPTDNQNTSDTPIESVPMPNSPRPVERMAVRRRCVDGGNVWLAGARQPEDRGGMKTNDVQPTHLGPVALALVDEPVLQLDPQYGAALLQVALDPLLFHALPSRPSKTVLEEGSAVGWGEAQLTSGYGQSRFCSNHDLSALVDAVGSLALEPLLRFLILPWMTISWCANLLQAPHPPPA